MSSLQLPSMRPDLEAAQATARRWTRKNAIRLRRWGARALVVATPLAIIAVDFGRRHLRISDFEPGELLFYFASAVVGVILWASLLAAATRIRGIGRWPVRVLVTVFALILVGSQFYTYARYGA